MMTNEQKFFAIIEALWNCFWFYAKIVISLLMIAYFFYAWSLYDIEIDNRKVTNFYVTFAFYCFFILAPFFFGVSKKCYEYIKTTNDLTISIDYCYSKMFPEESSSEYKPFPHKEIVDTIFSFAIMFICGYLCFYCMVIGLSHLMGFNGKAFNFGGFLTYVFFPWGVSYDSVGTHIWCTTGVPVCLGIYVIGHIVTNTLGDAIKIAKKTVPYAIVGGVTYKMIKNKKRH